MFYRNPISLWHFIQVYNTVEKDAQMNRTAQRMREIVLHRFSVYIRVCGEKNDETRRTHAKIYLHSICLQIYTDYVTFLFEKRFLRYKCKEHYCLYKRTNDYQ